MEKLYMGLIEIGWKRGVEGLNPDNLAYKMRVDEERSGLTRHEQGFACGLVLEGGSDVVAGAILTCLLALVHDPKSQRRARAEIDGFYDQDTLPKWQDEQFLPFIRAYDYYEGYLLPKGSTVLCSTWAIHNCAERFDEPEKFKPERYLNHIMSMAESVAQGDPLKRDHFGFGAGRRVCPGIQTAEQDIFIAFSRLVWAFDFTLPPGVEAVDVDFCSDAFVGEGVKTPGKFPLVITPRSERRVQTIEREVVIAQETFARYGLYK